MNDNITKASRRGFLGAAGTIAGAGLLHAPLVHAASSDILKVGLVGCGGRGKGAGRNAMQADNGVRLTAVADVFPDRAAAGAAEMAALGGPQCTVTKETTFSGFDAYQKLIDSGVDVVLLCTPPHFRPMQLEAAVKAGKHVFAEKPVAVDGPGIRRVLAASAEAKKKNLAVVSGFCYRYDTGMNEAIKKIHDGEIGKVLSLNVNYNTGTLWNADRKDGWSDMEFQLRNWLYYTWLSGDHIVEQHVHSIDKAAWVLGNRYPQKAWGLGGRQVRTDETKFGHIFDHHAVCFEYDDGTRVFSFCRQQAGTKPNVTDYAQGTKGTAFFAGMSDRIITNDAGTWKYKKARGKADDMYVNEHIALYKSIRAGQPINDGENMANSTLMAILGRMATYTGETISWDQALHSKEYLGPTSYEWTTLPTPTVAMPGITKFA